MKKSLAIISVLCLLWGKSGHAQNSILHETADSTTSVSNKTKEEANDTSFIHPEDHRLDVMYGIKAGFNRSNVYNGATDFNADPLMGWIAGLFISIPLNKLLGLHSELLYAQKGFKATGTTVDGNDYSFKRKTIYFDIPVLLQIKPNPNFSLFVGPLLSFPVSTKDKFDAGLITDEQKSVISNGIIHKNFFGAEAGIGIYIQHFIFSLRAGWDLQQLNDKATSDSRRYENSWIQATLGYRFKQ